MYRINNTNNNQRNYGQRQPNGFQNRMNVNNTVAKRNKCCSFCYNLEKAKCEERCLPAPDKDSAGCWSSHSLANNGVIKCPLLWFHVCKICSATGSSAHTETHCPNRGAKNQSN